MGKRRLGPTTQLYPMPTLLVAVRTGEGKANILTIAWAGIVGGEPPMMALEIGPSHYSTPFIEREGSFTVNIPNSAQVLAADYCGMVSGKEDPDKPSTCGFTLAPSTKIASPILSECPLNMECRIVARLPASRGSFYLVEILETHVDEHVLEGDHVSASALDPLIFAADGEYYRLGAKVGTAWSAGGALKR